LTPKFKDVDNLVNMLTYSMGGPSIDGGAISRRYPRHIIRYTPPVPEFEVMILTVDPGDVFKVATSGVPAIILVLEGAGKIDDQDVTPGKSFYWPTTTLTLELAVAESKRGPLKVAVAHKNRHIENPTAVNRDNFGTGTAGSSRRGSTHRVPASPLPYLGLGSPSNSNRKRETEAEFFEHDMPVL
jgi:mannose-6-phosphate isomerase